MNEYKEKDRRERKDDGLVICWKPECYAMFDEETGRWFKRNENPERYDGIYNAKRGQNRMPVRFCPEHPKGMDELMLLVREEMKNTIAKLLQNKGEEK